MYLGLVSNDYDLFILGLTNSHNMGRLCLNILAVALNVYRCFL